jgi:hypothetical protein
MGPETAFLYLGPGIKLLAVVLIAMKMGAGGYIWNLGAPAQLEYWNKGNPFLSF